MVGNKALIVPFGAWCVAQALKVIIALIKDKKLDFAYMIRMGGMPSSHAALTCALATTVGILDGFRSSAFAVAAYFAVVVMYDAAGVRQAVSRQASLLNRILDEVFKSNPKYEQRVRELIGHTRIQVFAGALLGIFLAWWWT